MSDGTSLTIGELGLLSRYDYVTSQNGVTNNNHIEQSATSMYIIDSNRKEILKFDEGIEKISITRNVDSYVKSVFWDDARIIYNRNDNEVLFFYKPTSTSSFHEALVFNESIQQFTGVYVYSRKAVGSVDVNTNELNDELILNNLNEVGLLSGDNYNKFFGTGTPSEITFLISNTNSDIVLYTMVEFIAEQLDFEGNPTNQFIDTIRIYNNEVDTGEMNFNDVTSLKFGKYRTSNLRNYIGNNERILSDHIFVTIKNNNKY